MQKLSGPTVTVRRAPFVQLESTVGVVKPASIKAGKSGMVTVTLTNNGNINATGNAKLHRRYFHRRLPSSRNADDERAAQRHRESRQECE